MKPLHNEGADLQKSDNELIAEFMGYVANNNFGLPSIFTNKNTISGWEYLQYDSRWDWLMPVCNKLKIRIGRVLKPSLRNGYLFVRLSSKGKAKAYSIHVLTALLFVINADNKPTVNHKDGNKTNNHFENLEWSTRSEQIKHAIRLGLFTPPPPPVKRGQ